MDHNNSQNLGPRVMSRQDFAALGLNGVAYVKPVQVQGVTAYAIHTANGEQALVVASRELAFATIRQNDLEPLSAH
ncbi:MAG: hypothetical protein OHK0024_04290 [Thalassobaculales bacterium]